MGKQLMVLGLGPSDINKVPLGVYRVIKEVGELYVRTVDHPIVNELKKEKVVVHSFDWIYEQYNEEFDQVYPAIVDELIHLINQKDKQVIYAVPGHPNVAERTTQLLRKKGVEYRLVGGASFIDDLFASVGVDPIEGFQLMDAFNLEAVDLNLGQHTVIMQVFHSLIASDLKLSLLEKYPADHLVYFVDAAGSKNENVIPTRLSEIDHFEGVHNLRSLYIPPLVKDQQIKSHQLLEKLVNQIERPHDVSMCFHQEEKRDVDEEIVDMAERLLDLHYQIKERGAKKLYLFDEVLEIANEKLLEKEGGIEPCD